MTSSRYIPTFLLVAMLIFCTYAQMDPESESPYHPERIVVRMRRTMTAEKVESAGLSNPTLLIRSQPQGVSIAAVPASTHLYDIADGSTVEDKVNELLQMPGVEIAEPDYKISVSAIPKDPLYSGQYQHARISAPAAWDTHRGSASVKVCVIDSGLRMDHPDLAGNVLKGFNVVPASPSDPPPEVGEPLYYNYNDTLGHGTHVAGIIGALGNNPIGGTGVAWKTSLIPCKFISDQGYGWVSDAIRCLDICREEEVHIYNNSWGDVRDFSYALLGAIEDIAASNGLFVVAAGNNGINMDIQPIYPGAYNTTNNLISVAATNRDDVFASFTNYGRLTVNLAAPGVDVLSTTRDTGYGYMSGTSMACPVVAGAAAVLQGMAMSAGTLLTPPQLVNILSTTVDQIPGGYSRVKSGGRLNLAKAMQKLQTMLPTPPVSTPAPPLAKSPLSFPIVTKPPGALSPFPPNSGLVPAICGTSLLKGRPASQSSTFNSREAGNAVNGDCRTNATDAPTACSSTMPTEDNPWWTSSLEEASKVQAISLTTRSDCCATTIEGARVLLGNATWAGPESLVDFVECGVVDEDGDTVQRGLRLTLQCETPTVAKHVVVYVDKAATSLNLCEVDATTE